MLLNIAIAENDDCFRECYGHIKRAYYDESIYLKDEYKIRLPDWTTKDLPDEEGQIEAIKKSLKNIITEVCKSPKSPGLYVVFEGDQIKMPFLDRYHEYFLRRQWNRPSRDPNMSPTINEIFRLHKDDSGQRTYVNYSKNAGDHNHFMNVVAATARLINYFSDPANVSQLFVRNTEDESSNKDRVIEYAKKIAYNAKDHGLRIFTLMLAAFYHDIGKTIVNHRHGMEGAIIISEHTSQSWYQLNRIAAKYPFSSSNPFERNDLMFVADMLDYHDQFGTLSTGEAGYIRLVDLIERIKRFSLKHPNRSDQKEWSERYLFDLWLLNIADIIVSLKGKYFQNEGWLEKESAIAEIKSFFEANASKASSLVHDLLIASKLLLKANEHKHTDYFTEVRDSAVEFSRRHSVERIRRLIFSTVENAIGKCKTINNNELSKSLTLDHNLSEKELTSSIVKAIQSIRNDKDFCQRLAWIGQMDYALGFFDAIASRALERICEEVAQTPVPKADDSNEMKQKFCFRTRWIRDKYSEPLGDDPEAEKYLFRLQGKLFVENLTITAIQILDYLLFREELSERLRNIEFNETRDRVNNEKIDTILSLNGPYQAKRAVQLILQTVFLY